MALIIQKKISAAIISLLLSSVAILLFTCYLTYIPFSDTSVEFKVTDIMYILTFMGITWYSLLDYIIHNLFSKQLVLVHVPGINKFHVKNAISTCIWMMSLLWASLLFTVITIPQQAYLEYYPTYIIVFSMFYSTVSSIRLMWKSRKNWWVYDLVFAAIIKVSISVMATGFFIMITKIIE